MSVEICGRGVRLSGRRCSELYRRPKQVLCQPNKGRKPERLERRTQMFASSAIEMMARENQIDRMSPWAAYALAICRARNSWRARPWPLVRPLLAMNLGRPATPLAYARKPGFWAVVSGCSLGLAAGVASVQAAGFNSTDPLPVCPAGVEAGLRPGLDGWIFNAADLREDFSIPTDAAEQLARLAAALAHTPTQVVVLMLPPRGLVAAKVVAPAPGLPPYNPARAEAEYRKLAQRFRDAGLTVVDALDDAGMLVASGQDFNFPRDHHPTARGAKTAAEALARTIRAHPNAAKLPASQWQTGPAGDAHVAGSRGGELAKVCGVEVPETTYRRYRTTRTAAASTSLLGDEPPAQVVLVGTSNVGDEFNLPGYLQEALSTDVFAVRTDGGGVLGSLDAYLRSQAWAEHPPAFLIWEFYAQGLPERRPGVPDPNVAGEYAQVIGAVSSGCTDAEAVWLGQLSTVEAGRSSFVPLPRGVPLAGSLHLAFDDVTLPSMAIELELSGGEVVYHRFEPFPRVATAGRFHLDLQNPSLRSQTAPLQPPEIYSVALKLPEPRPGGVTAKICPAKIP